MPILPSSPLAVCQYYLLTHRFASIFAFWHLFYPFIFNFLCIFPLPFFLLYFSPFSRPLFHICSYKWHEPKISKGAYFPMYSLLSLADPSVSYCGQYPGGERGGVPLRGLSCPVQLRLALQRLRLRLLWLWQDEPVAEWSSTPLLCGPLATPFTCGWPVIQL